MRGFLLSALVVAPVLAGCLTLPATGTNDPPQVAAPAWRVGESWNFTRTSVVDGRSSWRNLTVAGLDVILGQVAYRVLEREGPGDGRAAPSERIVHFERTNLNRVWDVCAEEASMALGPCSGRTPELDFPLWRNKTWSYVCCGDAIMDFRAVAVPVDPAAGLWRVVSSRAETDDGRVEILYDDQVGIWRERTRFTEKDGAIVPYETLALTDHHRPAA